ncbi:bifunctional serine/threonine-protein kinase/formylglycine-generating enzyme family protein [Pseudomarimonas arenosa]|uniref:Protein kinase n=1 Tax=Pseudomarimonas arenosa TaxID=2774145 RepID=A0AAW3ZL29_9GAMM|nr:protein kinase [Pseudomarimonas arenosa]
MIEIPGYTILGQIGRGGMATVYRARQDLLDREVALKVMATQLAADANYAQRFLQEARMLASLNHPNIVPVYDVGVTPQHVHYFSMQLLPGGDFASRLRDGMSENDLVRVLVAVASALGFAHARGIVHRDVTPGNIMFDGHDVPVLTDFGIARALTSTSRITATGLSIGTGHYMSPEQARGVEIDNRSDIYSLGVLLFEAVAGYPPYQGDDGFAVAFAHVHEPVPSLPEEAARWQPVIDKAMAKVPDQRYRDCAAFIEGLRQAAPEEFAAVASVTPRPMPSIKASDRGPSILSRLQALPKLPLLLGGGAVLSGVVLALGIWSSIRDNQRPPSKPPAKAVTKTSPAKPLPGPGAATVDSQVKDAPVEDLQADEELLPVDPEAPIATVVDPVVELLNLGKINLRNGRLTSPKPNNAFDRYQLVLTIEPGNAEAQQGLVDVGHAYVELAERVDADTETGKWAELLASAEQVVVNVPGGDAVASKVRSIKEQRLAEWEARIRSALQAWKRSEAQRWMSAYASHALDGSKRQALQALVNGIGKAGYQFQDALGSGRGPMMVQISDSVALGRYEVTVGDFREFWQAKGQARFSKLPDCRDSDTPGIVRFFSRKKLDWQKPDLPQDDQHPVVCVSYAMADAYVSWLAEQTGKPYRLPRSVELKPMVRPPTDCSANLRDAAFGQQQNTRKLAVSCNDGFPGTAPVGRFAERPPGLFDVVGNVREWTQNCERSDCKSRMAVGLSWESDSLSNTDRGFPAEDASNTIGFRVARDVEPPK